MYCTKRILIYVKGVPMCVIVKGHECDIKRALMYVMPNKPQCVSSEHGLNMSH